MDPLFDKDIVVTINVDNVTFQRSPLMCTALQLDETIIASVLFRHGDQ